MDTLDGESSDCMQERAGRFAWDQVLPEIAAWRPLNEQCCTFWINEYWLPAVASLRSLPADARFVQGLLPPHPLHRLTHELFVALQKGKDAGSVAKSLVRRREDLGEDRYELGEYFAWLLQKLERHWAPRSRKPPIGTATRSAPGHHRHARAKGLSEDQEELLAVLARKTATSRKSLMQSKELAKETVAKRDVASVKRDMKALITRRLARSHRGTRGGYWLTPQGLQRAEKLRHL